MYGALEVDRSFELRVKEGYAVRTGVVVLCEAKAGGSPEGLDFGDATAHFDSFFTNRNLSS